ncbi:uncharacterized protein LOC123513870 [Portunus trituberculatus]|uniref:uncharacterized protein LOC123513870 n=1 Tax=Portunus trituberculatus TaxID=210409 RepID=UPI001E1CE857|nr:uncharacterized protein LOC123513870 [Portunus trituberculatus]
MLRLMAVVVRLSRVRGSPTSSCPSWCRGRGLGPCWSRRPVEGSWGPASGLAASGKREFVGVKFPAIFPRFPVRHGARAVFVNSTLTASLAFPLLQVSQACEYDGKVAWEFYAAQFDLLAAAQGWDQAEKALQLATALRGPAIEVFSHLPPTQRASFPDIAEALRRRFGHRHQAEVYRAQLKKRTRQRGETLSQLAHDVEALVRRAYRTAGEEMVTMLARDAFLDALVDHQLQIYVRQAHPADVQVALARAMEFEAFILTANSLSTFARPRSDVRGRKAQVKRRPASRAASPGAFCGRC